MYRGDKTKKISFRVTDSYYNTIYTSYLHFKNVNHSTLSFSDYLRNYCFSALIEKYADENNNKHYNIQHPTVLET